MEEMKKLQDEGKILLPDELVRRVKAGPGPGSLGHAQQTGQEQSGEQHSIDSETLAIVGNLESAWTGQGGDGARMGLRPLAEVSSSASTAMHDSQGALSDQMTSFQTTRDSLQDVSSEAPGRDVVDTMTPWDTDTEDAINQRNGAIQKNNEIYQGFTSSSDANGAKMPIDYGQIADSADGGFELAPPPPVEPSPRGTDDGSAPSPGRGDGYAGPAPGNRRRIRARVGRSRTRLRLMTIRLPRLGTTLLRQRVPGSAQHPELRRRYRTAPAGSARGMVRVAATTCHRRSGLAVKATDRACVVRAFGPDLAAQELLGAVGTRAAVRPVAAVLETAAEAIRVVASLVLAPAVRGPVRVRPVALDV